MNSVLCRLALACVVGPGCAILLTAQALPDQQPPQLSPRVRSTRPVPGQEAEGFLQPIKCDARGNIYVRLGGSFMTTPVARIARDGSSVKRFSLADAPRFDRHDTFSDFAVDLRGNVYLITTRLASREGTRRDEAEQFEQVIVAFDSDGKYSSTVKLEALLKLEHLAVFPSGEFFVYGEKANMGEGHLVPTGRPFTAIFDRQGRLIKELALADDIEGESKSAMTDPLQVPPAERQSLESGGETRAGGKTKQKLSATDFGIALSLGKAVPAENGNIYLMRATRDPIFYAIAPNGSVVHQFVVAAPEGATRPISFHIGGGRIVVMFMESGPRGSFKSHRFVVANAETGEALYQFAGPRELGGGFACYTPNGMVFLGDDGHQLVLRETYPF